MNTKKMFFFFCLLSGLFFYGQNRRFIYEYKYSIDSTAKDKQETEMMLLDVSPKGSKFYSKDYFESDSIMKATFEKQIKSGTTDFNINLTGVKFRGKVRYSVEKSYPGYSVNYYMTLAADEYQVQDGRTQNWKILPDKAKVGEFAAQKATCEFAGRKWIAWFTPDLPIQDGPYKFHGLPGLIVKLEDTSNTHVFELKGVRKLPEGYEWESVKDKERYDPLIVVNEKKYKKAFKDFLNDPMKGHRKMMGQGVTIEMRDSTGKIIDPEIARRDQEKRMKDQLKKQNNILELDLLK